MSEWTILIKRPHHWQQLPRPLQPRTTKRGWRNEGGRRGINSKNASPKSCGQCSKAKEKNNKNQVEIETAMEGIFIETHSDAKRQGNAKPK